MKQELVKLDEEMNNEIKMIKDKYSCLKENVHKGQNRNKFKKRTINKLCTEKKVYQNV